jgi:hypothetical protein
MRRYNVAKPRELRQAVAVARRNTWVMYWTDALVAHVPNTQCDALRQAATRRKGCRCKNFPQCIDNCINALLF